MILGKDHLLVHAGLRSTSSAGGQIRARASICPRPVGALVLTGPTPVTPTLVFATEAWQRWDDPVGIGCQTLTNLVRYHENKL